ncbi:MAG: L-seryl-tRNA(Sec) selenium transferase [Chloroflexi bacterium]|nr:MAG: L-seryl-tRNA(Sec) selenium transferase [Chloroflexota bacterium]
MAARNPYRSLPSVDRLLSDERVRALANGGESGIATVIVRQAIESARLAIAGGSETPTEDQLVESVLGLAAAVFEPSLRPVINATGVIIHTNLGRAPLSDEAIEAMAAVSRGYSNLEFDLEAGERGSRYGHLEPALTRLTGAEAAIAVNNNASALLLTLSTLARDHDVIISRGQAVEIGGGFRIPDVMAQSGARLVEVGTTNRTYLRDYEAAITEQTAAIMRQTAAIMRVHASNFRIVGFTDSPSIHELGGLAHRRGVLLIDDIGSGCLVDTTQFGLAPEPTVGESLAAGADLVLFSGDKLLGGPQAGVIAGKSELIAQLRRHPLARAVRMDKASIAGLTATLHHYLRGEALNKVPVWRMIATPRAEIERRARRWARAIGRGARIVDGRSMIGGGSLPEESLPTKLLALDGEGGYVAEIARRLRTGDPTVVARIERDVLLLDPRTVRPDEDRALIAAVKEALSA